jgi:XTP/dITP diphosphohydrolase
VSLSPGGGPPSGPAAGQQRPRVLLGTSSQKKIAELRPMFAGLPVDLVTPAEVGLDIDPEETGATLEENARIKALAFARAAQMPALADDSGLEVDALGGAPGVYSKRFAGPDATDADRIALLLDKLADVPDAERTARFRCVIALATPEDVAGSVAGTCEGSIGRAPRGSNGFGYDPVFLVGGTRRTMAELSTEEKNQVSHRGRAAAAARALVETWLRDRP